MAKTMHWQLIPGVAHVVVHTSENPSDEEWEEYLQSIVPHVRGIKGMLAYAATAGPSAKQRQRATELWGKVGFTPQVAVMTPSRLIAGIVTAMSWVMGSKIRAFGPTDFVGASNSLALGPEDQALVKAALVTLGKTAGTKIAAFEGT